MIRPSVVALILSCLLCTSHGLSGQITAGELEALVDSIMDHPQNDLTSGSAVAIVQDGKVLLTKGYGYASLEHRRKIDPLTSFDIASVSKQFAGFAVAMLIEDGRIGLHDDVRKYIPELKDFGQLITINHLLHHTSGIRDWTGTLPMAGYRNGDRVNFDQILRMAYAQEELNFSPGTEFQYSSLQ